MSDFVDRHQAALEANGKHPARTAVWLGGRRAAAGSAALGTCGCDPLL